MAVFDSSGCPSDFIAIIQRHEADLQDHKNLIAKEKQLIKDFEMQIAEKLKLTKTKEVKTAELESSIEHMHALYTKQLDSNKRLNDTKVMLKEQVKSKSEKLEMIRKKNQRIKLDCEAKYKWYADQYIARMNFYETLPLVPEFKEKMSEIVELHHTLLQYKKCSESLHEEIEELIKKKVESKPKLTLKEWGVELAALYQEYMKLDQLDNDSSITNLEEEVEILKQKKLFVQKKQAVIQKSKLEALTCTASDVEDQKIQITKENNADPSTSLPSKKLDSKQYSVPDFRSFFKTQAEKLHKHGSSGSSLKSTTNFSISSLSTLPVSNSNQKSTIQKFGSTVKSNVIDDSEVRVLESTLKTSQDEKSSLKKRSFKTGRSLEEWLNPSLQAKTETFVNSSRSEVADLSKETPSKTNLNSSSFTLPPSHLRMTEVPLLRQVQEKILQRKRVQGQDEPNVSPEKSHKSSGANDHSTTAKNVDRGEVTNQNKRTPFDGLSFEVPMATNEEPPSTSSEKSIDHCKSPKHKMFEEHQRMMMELQKSPEEYFRYQANMMPMDGGDSSFLINPSHQPPSKSPLRSGNPTTSGSNDFQFAVPTDLPPGHLKRNFPASEFSFGETKKDQPSPPSNFSGFAFQSSEKESKSDSESFIFGNSQPERSESESSFSFSFVKNNSLKSPETVASTFSLSATSPEKSPVNFFNIKSDEKEEGSNSSSFAALFGF